MPKNLLTQAQLQTKINRLEQENTRLRTLFQIIFDVAYQAVNKEPGREETNQLPRLLSCASCKKAINLETNPDWKYEAETGRYWCRACLSQKKETSHE